MNTLLQVGIVLTAMDKMSGVLTGAADKAAQGFARLQQRVVRVGQAMTEMGTKASLMGHGLLAGLETPIKAFADLDEASTNLRVAMMDNLGQVSDQFAEINRQAIEYGNKLPGTTADFVNTATALLANGTAMNDVVGGAFKAASYLGVLLKQPPAQAAEMVAKFREAFGLAGSEMTKMADLTQKAKFGFGLDPDEIRYSVQYAGATLNMLKLTGAENAKRYLAMQGILRQHGMEGSVVGTNTAEMMNRMGMLNERLHRRSKIMKEVNADLKAHHIQLSFFNKQGNFVGFEGVIAQLQKLNVLSQQDKLVVMKNLFGDQAMRVAAILADAGVEGFNKALETIDKQADLNQRLEAITASAKNTWEALTGTITNFWAAVGGPMVTSLYPLINKVNEFVGGPLMAWVDRNKELVKWVGLITLGIGGLLVVLGALGIIVGIIGSGLAVAFAVASSPVTLLIAIIAAGAALILDNWDEVADFFKGFGIGFKKGLEPIMPYLEKIGDKFTWLAEKAKDAGRWIWKHFMPNTLHGLKQQELYLDSRDGRQRSTVGKGIDAGNDYGTNFSNNVMYHIKNFQDAWNGIKSLPEQASQNWNNFWDKCAQGIEKFRTAIHGIRNTINENWNNVLDGLKSFRTSVETFFSDFVKEFFDFGSAMMDMLVAGIKSGVNSVVDAVSSVAGRMRGFFNRSPAKEGPLRDIHRHTFSQMVAAAIRPEPIVSAIRAVTAAGMLALAPLTNPVLAMPAMQPLPFSVAAARSLAPTPMPPVAKPMPRPATPAASGQGGGVTVHFAPQITIQGQAGPMAKDDIMAALKAHEHELVRLIQDVMARNARRSY